MMKFVQKRTWASFLYLLALLKLNTTLETHEMWFGTSSRTTSNPLWEIALIISNNSRSLDFPAQAVSLPRFFKIFSGTLANTHEKKFSTWAESRFRGRDRVGSSEQQRETCEGVVQRMHSGDRFRKKKLLSLSIVDIVSLGLDEKLIKITGLNCNIMQIDKMISIWALNDRMRTHHEHVGVIVSKGKATLCRPKSESVIYINFSFVT